MADSAILGIPQVAPNQNNKETTINDGVSILERSLNDVFVIAMTGNVTVTANNYRRHQVLQVTPSAGGFILYVPKQKRFFAVCNISGSFSFTVRQTGESSGGVLIPAGSYVILSADGADVLRKIADSATATFENSFRTLTDTPMSYGTAGQLTRMNGAGDGLEYWTLDLSLGDLNDTPAARVPLQYLRVTADGTGHEYVPANPGGETEFTLLNDTPNSYGGSIGMFLRVNAAGDGLEFAPIASIMAFTDLSDSPASYTGNSGRLLRVNGGATALEFVDYPSFGNTITRVMNTSNDGFEEGIVIPWEPTDDLDAMYYSVDGVFGSLGPGAGLYSLKVEAEDIVFTEVTSQIDLTAYADTTELDNSARLTVPYMFLDALNNGATGTVSVAVLDSVGAEISTFNSGTIASAGVWVTGVLTGVLPVGARTVSISLLTTAGAPLLLAGWDDLVCSLTITEKVSFIDLPDTPATYAGQGGKVLKVNGTSDGVSFAQVSYNEITGLPSSLTGQAGKALRVNGSLNGYELFDVFPAYDLPESLMVLRVNAAGSALEWATPTGGGGGGIPEAPEDGEIYGRQDADWVIVPSGGGGGGITDAPSDGKSYVRKDADWIELPKTIEVTTLTASAVLALTHAGNYVRVSTAVSATVTIPNNSDVAFPIGTIIQLRQVSEGTLAIEPAAGVTLNSPETRRLRKAGSSAALVKAGTNEWDLTGDLEVVS